MSTEALHHVLYRSDVRGFDRLVLIAYADSADAGTGYGFSSVDTLSGLAKVNRTTLMDATARLEEAGELLVRRPDVRARGRSNQYVVVMSRDPLLLADEWGWPRPALSPTAVARAATAPRPVDKPSRHRTERSAPPTEGPTERSANGRPTVGQRSPQDRPSPAPAPSPTRASASRRSRAGGARPGPAVDKRLQELRELCDQRAAVVPWLLGAPQVEQAVALVLEHGAAALADAAAALVRRRGEPRSAAAWVQAWALLPLQHRIDVDAVPTQREPCGQCDGHLGGPRMLVDDDGRPTSPCPRCHPSSAPGTF